MDSGDKYCMPNIQANRKSVSCSQMNVQEDILSPNIFLNKLNIPLNCLGDDRIRQQYLEEYSAKYFKAKHLLNNARKKQRKIIMIYYEEKVKQNNIDELQTIKESLLNENEKIKKFKDALKDKLTIYQKRIQLLQDTEFWSTYDIGQTQNNTHGSIEYCAENHLVDNICTTNTYEYYYSELKLNEDNMSSINNNDYDNKLNDSFDNNAISNQKDDHNLIEINLKHPKQLNTKLISEIDQNIDIFISEKQVKQYFQWLKKIGQFIFMLISNDRFQIISMILMFGLSMFVVIFVNNLLEHFLIYITKSSTSITTVSSQNSMPESSFSYLLSNIYNWTTSWVLLISHIFSF
ncbi:unnamed protein product [Rotaria socialis]|uniref:Uncharacterized protein n=1 Tax=Rotaria socialis TaxID=392032 RepID=A0A817SIC7_9BILA|nr:unnamed protein product [Rotaria socialis]